jgi:SAM-dependent methyltransferase
LRWLWFKRSGIPILNSPLPWRLPFGGWFFAYGDAVGFNVASATFKKEYENLGEWKFLARFLKQGMCFFDIGANQGFFTLLAAQIINGSGRVVAFEPSPREFARLSRNIKINRFENVVFEPVALGV